MFHFVSSFVKFLYNYFIISSNHVISSMNFACLMDRFMCRFKVKVIVDMISKIYDDYIGLGVYYSDGIRRILFVNNESL